MGFAAFAGPALVLHLGSAKICVLEGKRNRGEGEFAAPTSVKLLHEQQRWTRYFAKKAALNRLNKLNGDTGLVCYSQKAEKNRLLLTHVENRVSFENKKSATLCRAAEKLGNLSQEKTREGAQKFFSCVKTLGRRWNSNSLMNIVINHSRVVTTLEYEGENRFRGPVHNRPRTEPANGSGRRWKLLGGIAAGAVTVATGGAALKGIKSGSAQASCGDGGFGHSVSGHGGGGDGNGGGGEGGHGGFDGGGNEGFIADSISNAKKEQDENPTVSISFVKKTSVSTLPSLASLSSAAGEFIDGEAPIGEDYTSRNFGTIDSYRTIELSNSESPYSPMWVAQDRQNLVGRSHYKQDEDSFLGSEADERPSSAGGEQDYMNRNDKFPASRSSPSYDGPSSVKPSSPEQTSANSKNVYQDRNRLSSRFPGPLDPSPQSSISFGLDTKTAVTSEPRGIGQESFRPHQVHERTDILNWVSGLLDSIIGKRSGDKNCSAQDKLLDDDEKKGLVAETAALACKLLSENGDEFARKFETNALRRLQRETFSDLLKVRERLERVEHKTGLWGKTHGDSLTGARTNLRGEVSSGGAFIVTEDSACVHSRATLHHAGLKTGLDVRFTFETSVREGDILTTQVGVGQGSGTGDGNSFGGPLNVQKINYVAQISDSLSVTVAPLGARASDMSDTMNHLQGQALTTFAGSGPALYQHCKGSAIGASLRSSTVLLSMSQFLSGWGNATPDATAEPLCLSTLAQFMLQPCDHLVLALSAVNNVWPSPPTPTSRGLHWSEMGPLVLCKTVTRPSGAFIFNRIRPSAVNSIRAQGNLPTESWSPGDSMRNRGIAMQSVALAGEVDLAYRVSLGGWAQVDRGDWLSEFEKKELQWNISVAKCTGRNVNWGLSMGRRKREDWHDDGLSPIVSNGPDDPSPSQMQMEVFATMGCGKRFTLQTGIVYMIDKHAQTSAFMLRSSWIM